MPDYLDDEAIKKAIKSSKLVLQDEELRYHRFREGAGKIERGTMILGKRIIRGYGHIKRIFTLENGLARNMKSKNFYAEEKIDGYNLRIAYVAGKIYAFSRGGFIDYFATEKARGLIGKKFFLDFPASVLCCEMVGNTPYTRPTRQFDVKIYVFDILGGNGYVDCDAKYKLLKKYGIDGVPFLGKFSHEEKSMKKLRETALMLHRGAKEGMVLKGDGRMEAVKYVTPAADIEDIANNAHLLFDMPLGFYAQRVLRSAIFIRDFDFDRKKFEADLGNAFYARLEEALRGLESGKSICEEFEITIKDAKIWEWIKKHMSREVKLETISESVDSASGKTTIKFRKIYHRSDRLLRSFLAGKGIVD